jgi:hypothetical protein
MMISLSSIVMFFASKTGKYIFGAGTLVALFVGFTHQQRNIGRREATAAIEKVTENVVSKANHAGTKSKSDSYGGVRSKYYRD